jgi:energy-coupling factor transporter ATP-binding protein EcfA2
MTKHNFLVVGTPGSGKTTLAKTIADRYGLLHIECDKHRFVPGSWTKVPCDEFVSRVLEEACGPGVATDRGWVIDTSLFDAHDPENSRVELVSRLLKEGKVGCVITLMCPLLHFSLENIEERHRSRAESRALVGSGVVETDEAVEALKKKITENWGAIVAALVVFSRMVTTPCFTHREPNFWDFSDFGK